MVLSSTRLIEIDTLNLVIAQIGNTPPNERLAILSERCLMVRENDTGYLPLNEINYARQFSTI